MSRRALPLLLLAAALAPAARADAQTGPPYLRLVEPTEAACRAGRQALGRARRAAQQEALCLVGTAYDPAGVAKVTVNGEAARLSPDSAGVASFVGFIPPAQGQVRVELAMEGKGGATLTQRYGITTAGADGAYTMTNLSPRILGAPSAAELAQQQAAAQPVQVASAGPAPSSSAPASTPASTATTSDAGAPAPAPPSPAPASTDAAAGGAAPAGAPAATQGMGEDAQNYVRITEPAEWTGLATRGLTVVPRTSVRVVGLTALASGVTRVEVNGVRAAFGPDQGGAVRFVAYVASDPSRRDVEVVVRGNSGPPLVRRFPVEPAAAVARTASADAAPAAAPAGQRFRGKRWAVVVGVSNYQDTAVTALRYADADARAFHDFLRSERAGGGGFAAENVKLLLNEGATFREIRSALFTFLKGATEDDQVVIYFAGHGAPDPQRLQNLYLLTHDTDVADIAGTAFPMDDVNKAIRSLYARDIVVITDACHSAGVGGQVATRDLGANQINESFLQALNASTGGLAIFTASGANQLSQEDARWGGGHGVFTHFMLEALNGAADEDGDRMVSLLEMMEYTRAKVRAETRNAQIPTISQTTYDPYLPMSIVLDPAQAGRLAQAAATPSATAPTPARPSAPPPSATQSRALAGELAAAQEAVGLYPTSAVWRKRLGVALRDAGRVDEALAELSQAAKMDPTSAEYRYELGVTYLEAGKAAEAARELEVAARERNSARYQNAYGRVLAETGARGDDAVDLLRRAVRLQPDSAAYRRDLGRALVKAGKAEEGIVELRAATVAAPQVASYHLDLARALEESGKAFDAVPEYQHAVRLDSANARARFELGRVLRYRGADYEGLVELRHAARMEPGNAAYRYELGKALSGSAASADAVSELRESVKLEPASAAYQNALGVALRKAGQPRDAEAALREAVKLDGSNAQFHFDLGGMLEELGQYDAAAAEMQSAIQLDASRREWREALNAVRRRLRT